MQFLGSASVVGVLVAAGVSAASTLRTGDATAETTSEGAIAADPKPAALTKAAVKSPAPKATEPVVQQSAEKPVESAPAIAAPPPTPAPVATKPAASVTHAGYVLVEGRSQLTDSIFAVRTGDSVVVNFDAYGYRTRRSDKLEQSLRTTMPLVFGKSATAFIDTLADGGLVTNRDVIGELATSGMLVKLDNGTTARIRVLTRIVSDGPIAIGYLTTVER
jgi:hypothetical protein